MDEKVFLWLLRGLDQEIQAEKEAWAQKSWKASSMLLLCG